MRSDVARRLLGQRPTHLVATVCQRLCQWHHRVDVAQTRRGRDEHPHRSEYLLEPAAHVGRDSVVGVSVVDASEAIPSLFARVDATDSLGERVKLRGGARTLRPLRWLFRLPAT